MSLSDLAAWLDDICKLIDDREMWDIVTHDLASLKATIESTLLEVGADRNAE